jgi:hypothetical protein
MTFLPLFLFVTTISRGFIELNGKNYTVPKFGSLLYQTGYKSCVKLRQETAEYQYILHGTCTYYTYVPVKDTKL